MKLFHRADPAIPRAILDYLEIIAEDSSRDDPGIFELMMERGHGRNLSWQIVGLIPCFASRAKLAGLGINFSEEFEEFDLESTLLRSGKLKKHEVWSAALNLRKKIMDCSAIDQMVLRSAEFTAISEARNAGSDPSNLATTPIAILVIE
jgi:hypothetical protein